MSNRSFVVATALATIALGAFSSPALAGVVTEADLTSIYTANPPFNAANEITVVWLAPVITITSVNYDILRTAADTAALFALPGQTVWGKYGNGPIQQITLPSSPVDDVFFIEQILNCGGPGDGIVGCAPVGGQGIALNSDFVAGPGGQQTEGHELGHNLGLQHCQTTPANCPAAQPDGSYLNLMNAFINGSLSLTAAQRNIILTSGLIQVDANGDNFIELQPIVFAPEPTSVVLFGVGLSLLAVARRKRNRA